MKRLFFPLAMLALTACQPEPNVALRIDCGSYNDQGVAIQLNGQAVGECPLDIMTLAGQTEVEIHKLFSDSGFIQERQTLQLAENVNKRVIFQPKLQYPERHYYELATTVAGAAEYLKRFPNGQYAAQVTETARQLEEASYNKAIDLEGVTAYLKLYPADYRSAEVKAKREQLEQEEASYKKAVDLEGMAAYLKLYPADYRSAEVKAKREKIRLISGRWYDNLDGTITDRKTGLTWMRCRMGQKWDGRSCGGKAKEYTWSEANLAGQGVDFAGHQDWRLPTVRELFTLVVCSSGKIGAYTADLKDGHAALKGGCLGNYTEPTLDTQAFPNTEASWVWSSSAVAGGADVAWSVSFIDGYPDWSNKGYGFQLRLVRSGQ